MNSRVIPTRRSSGGAQPVGRTGQGRRRAPKLPSQAVLARPLDVTAKPYAPADAATAEEARRCDGECLLVGCGHD
ncbi:hypothetical protein [Streptomyces sp. NPDC010273]|uniref:hypothetical protein n=1 Tax=Streptomyces sp. NPDC010273 TaxID=3364829 RepID=UPI0036E912B6